MPRAKSSAKKPAPEPVALQIPNLDAMREQNGIFYPLFVPAITSQKKDIVTVSMYQMCVVKRIREIQKSDIWQFLVPPELKADVAKLYKQMLATKRDDKLYVISHGEVLNPVFEWLEWRNNRWSPRIITKDGKIYDTAHMGDRNEWLKSWERYFTAISFGVAGINAKHK